MENVFVPDSPEFSLRSCALEEFFVLSAVSGGYGVSRASQEARWPVGRSFESPPPPASSHYCPMVFGGGWGEKKAWRQEGRKCQCRTGYRIPRQEIEAPFGMTAVV